MGVAPDIAGSALRVSLGWTTTADDIEQFISAWAKIKARRKAA
jgi:cysteine desulfurase